MSRLIDMMRESMNEQSQQRTHETTIASSTTTTTTHVSGVDGVSTTTIYTESYVSKPIETNEIVIQEGNNNRLNTVRVIQIPVIHQNVDNDNDESNGQNLLNQIWDRKSSLKFVTKLLKKKKDADSINLLPSYHYKCRFDKNDKNCVSDLYTRTKDVHRFPVPINRINWIKSYQAYEPTNFTSEKIKDKSTGGGYKDADVNESQYDLIKFNTERDELFNCSRISHHDLEYKLEFNQKLNKCVPLNPVGRTGLIGRGHLGRWGPNHAADPVVTRWKRDENNQIIRHAVTNRPILQFVAIQRRDTKEWAIPGGMRFVAEDPGEVIQKTLVREFAEEALSIDLKFNKLGGVTNVNEEFEKFFSSGILIYKGYVDDPRNTDNSWMETVVMNFHDENSEFVGNLKLHSGDDAEKVQWMDVDSSLQLFASHTEYLYETALEHDAHW